MKYLFIIKIRTGGIQYLFILYLFIAHRLYEQKSVYFIANVFIYSFTVSSIHEHM